MSKVVSKQEILREKLISQTLKVLEAEGVVGVKARDLATSCGCSVGTIYNLFGELENLVLFASARTLKEYRLFAEAAYRESLKTCENAHDRLMALSSAYIDFATQHPKRWQANFEIKIDPESDYFRVYTEEHNTLMQIIVTELARISPSEDPKQLLSIGRALWGAVHGITVLAMSNPGRMIGREKILVQCSYIIDPMIEKLQRSEAERSGA